MIIIKFLKNIIVLMKLINLFRKLMKFLKILNLQFLEKYFQLYFKGYCKNIKIMGNLTVKIKIVRILLLMKFYRMRWPMMMMHKEKVFLKIVFIMKVSSTKIFSIKNIKIVKAIHVDKYNLTKLRMHKKFLRKY